MKTNELMGAEVIAIDGDEGYGCERCKVPRGRPECRSIILRLLGGTICELTIEGVCPPDMDSGWREQMIVAKGIDV